MRQSRKAIVLILIVSLSTLLVSTTVSTWLNDVYNSRFSSRGTIVIFEGLEIYGGDLINNTGGNLILDWGTLYPGHPVTRSFNIKNKSSNLNVTVILFDITRANVTFLNYKNEVVTEAPPIDRPIILSSSFNGTMLGPKEEIPASLTLQISSDASFLQYLVNCEIAGFIFDINIEAFPLF